MSWIVGQQNIKLKENVHEYLGGLVGELDDITARISLAKYFRYNVGIASELLLGVKLEKFQIITINGFFNRNYNMLIWGRGGSKTFCAAIYCILKCIFEPGTKILIASINFRTSRRMFGEIEKILDRREAFLGKQCFGNKSKRGDQFEWTVNGGSITAIPLNGERIRGIRANVLMLDEFLLLPQEIIDTVLIPFLSAPRDVDERIRIRDLEDKLIAKGLMRETERMAFANTSQMFALSSASYTFEHLFEVYEKWCKTIDDPDAISQMPADTDSETIRKAKLTQGSYFVSQIGYEAMPEHMIDQAAIQIAKSGGSSHASFLREYCARFVDGGEGYFAPEKMGKVTIEDGKYPTTKIVGDKDKKYLLAIDPNFNASKTSDYFAMCVAELNDESRQPVIVHNYQRAGCSVGDHIKYLFYVLKSFNIVMVILDNAGGEQFINAANESQTFKEANLKLGFFEFNSDKENEDYLDECREAVKAYNTDLRTICFRQVFTSTWLMRSNQFLQASIDHKRVWFASRAANHPDIFDKMCDSDFPIDLVYPSGLGETADNEFETRRMSVREFIDWQDYLIKDVKDQCALIEVTSTGRGTQSFELPSHLKGLHTANRPRKDNYTALLLANWGTKCYYDIIHTPKKKRYNDFIPTMF